MKFDDFYYLEERVTENTALYHRTNKVLPVGQIINYDEQQLGPHHLRNSIVQNLLEEYREKKLS